MSTLDELQRKVEDLTKRHRTASSKKAELKGQLQAKKEELVSLGEEIRNAGYDPKNLKSERDKAQGELEALIDSFERDLTEVEAALAAFDKKDPAK